LLGNIKIPKLHDLNFFFFFFLVSGFFQSAQNRLGINHFFFNLYHLPKSVVRNKISKTARIFA
jgi:hypothetical protein